MGVADRDNNTLERGLQKRGLFIRVILFLCQTLSNKSTLSTLKRVHGEILFGARGVTPNFPYEYFNHFNAKLDRIDVIGQKFSLLFFKNDISAVSECFNESSNYF